MKFNWGHGIFTFLAVFLLAMGFVVYKSFQQNNSLVESEYYPKGLEYQKQIERIANADSLKEKITVAEVDGKILITYPQLFKNASPEGTLYFYRPSDDAGDHTEKMLCDSSLIQVVPAQKLMAGKYIVKMNWKMNGKEFYHEQQLMINP